MLLAVLGTTHLRRDEIVRYWSVAQHTQIEGVDVHEGTVRPCSTDAGNGQKRPVYPVLLWRAAQLLA